MKCPELSSPGLHLNLQCIISQNRWRAPTMLAIECPRQTKMRLWLLHSYKSMRFSSTNNSPTFWPETQSSLYSMWSRSGDVERIIETMGRLSHWNNLLCAVLVLFPSFTKWILFCWVWGFSSLFVSFSSVNLAISFSTWSCRHLYLPCESSTLQLASIWFRLDSPPHSRHVSSEPNQTFMFAGVGKRYNKEIFLLEMYKVFFKCPLFPNR